MGANTKNMPDVVDENDPRWMGRRELATLIGVSERRMDQLRHQIGGEFEKTYPGQRKVCIWAPAWLNAWRELLLDGGWRSRSDESTKELIDQRKLEKLDIELAEKRGQLVPLVEVKRHFEAVGACLKQPLEAIGDISKEAQELVIEGLKSGEAELRKRFGGNGDAD